jgi:hypothetical protein
MRKKVIGKPCEGKLHARFDEGVMGESPLLYSTFLRIKLLTRGVSVGMVVAGNANEAQRFQI